MSVEKRSQVLLGRPLHYADLGALNRDEMEAAITARVQTVPIGDGRVLARVLGGPKMFLSTDDLGFGCHVMMDGFWEGWLTSFFARTVTAGMTVFDIGANFGYYTVLFAMGVGPTGRVVAIEPVPSTAASLRDTIQLNGYAHYVRLVSAAATSRAASEALILAPPREPKNAAIVPQPCDGSFTVPTCTVDDLAADLDRLDLVKIDVEGSEVEIIAGMRHTIARLRPSILLEYNAARYADPRAFLDELLEAYGRVRNVGWNGNLEDVSPQTILSSRVGEDWLLFFSRRSI